MNQLELTELLEKARKRKLDETPGAWPKIVVARVDFEHNGWKYVKDEEHELDQDTAKELFATGKVEIAKGGVCDVSSVRRVGKEMLYAYRSWRLGPSTSNRTLYDDVMLRVRLNTSMQVVVRARIPQGAEFFIPFGEIRDFDPGLESAPDNRMHRIDILADQE